MVKLSIIILTYNSSGYIFECLSSILSFYNKELENKELELVIFDNASSDSTVNQIKKFISKEKLGIKLIVNKENLGFAKGINKAAENATGEYFLLLNPDVKVIDRGIEKAVEFMDKNKSIGIMGGKIIDENGKKELSCGNFYDLKNTFFLSMGLENLLGVRFSPNKEKQVDFVSGGFMIVRKNVFEEVSGFDENYFMYVEDMDLCFRAKNIGFETFFFPYATIKHYMHGSSDRSFAIENIYKGILLFYKKNKSSIEYFLAKKLLFSKARLIILFGSLLGKRNLVLTYKKAINI